jgi:hypothetical protein
MNGSNSGMVEIKDGSTHLCTSLCRTNITGRCASSHFISVSTLNNYSNVINQTLLWPLNIQLAFLDLALCFQNLFLIRMNIIRFL